MLVLSRQRDESVVLTLPSTDAELLALRGQKITTSVIDIHGDKVRIGYNAPKSIMIFRDELQVQVDQDLNARDAKQVVQTKLRELALRDRDYDTDPDGGF